MHRRFNYSRFLLKLFGYAFAFIGSCGPMMAEEFCEDSSQVILTTNVEWQTPSVGNVDSASPYTPLWHYKGSTYYVWIDAKYRPWVTQITAGTATTAPLDNGADYVVQSDGHHRFSMGIDKNGYIHITGDMHNYTYHTTDVIYAYPTRYQKQQILYWKSNQPMSVTDGFTFVGGRNASTAIPGTGWISGRFFTDNHGELYYSSHMHAIEVGNYPGEMGLGLYKYDASALSWKALGGLPDNTRPGDYFTTLFWSNSGLAPSNWFQNFQGAFKFDVENRLHFAVGVISNSKVTGEDRVIYAVSNDGGVSWEKADGTLIPALPIRGEAGHPNVGDVVVDVGTGPSLNAATGLIVDKNGVPSVFVSNRSFKWSGAAWVENTADYAPLPAPTYGYLDQNEDLLLHIRSIGKVSRSKDLDSKRTGYDFSLYYNSASPQYNSIDCIDEYELRRTGVLYNLATNSTTHLQSILKTVITPAPLPAGWKNKDISLPLPPYGGFAGYMDGIFQMCNHGSGILNQTDGFHFIYKTLTGDGSIIARVNTSLASADGYSTAGVMMRAHLSTNSINANMLLAPGKKDRGAIFGARAEAGGWGFTTAVPGIPNSSWVKLIRAGNTFTGYVSKDGSAWVQVGQTTIVMPNTIYVGLAGNSRANDWLMQTVKFDNVVVSP